MCPVYLLKYNDSICYIKHSKPILPDGYSVKVITLKIHKETIRAFSTFHNNLSLNCCETSQVPSTVSTWFVSYICVSIRRRDSVSLSFLVIVFWLPWRINANAGQNLQAFCVSIKWCCCQSCCCQSLETMSKSQDAAWERFVRRYCVSVISTTLPMRSTISKFREYRATHMGFNALG